MFAKILRLLKGHPWLVHFYNKRKFPRLQVAIGVNLSVSGTFEYGENVGLGVGSNIFVPNNSFLRFEERCYVGRYVEISPNKNIEIGRYTTINDRCIFLGDVVIGGYCLFAPNVYVSSSTHYFDMNPNWLIRDQDQYACKNSNFSKYHSKPVRIGDDCWFGINTVVMPGVTVGKGAVIGANSVVTRDVLPYEVIAGVPAKTIKKRLEFFPLRHINYLDESTWPYFYSGFLLNSLDNEQTKNSGAGFTAFKRFSVYMDINHAEKIFLSIRSAKEYGGILRYQNQKRYVHNTYEVIEFKLNSEDSFQEELFFNAEDEMSFQIKEVWVE
jgi:acetyltransferase-like isoleucine patch superfamily enzyme